MEDKFDFDYFVIGGGSGGLASTLQAYKHGVKVAIADYVRPSPAGSSWGLGGTCINVGCIPKKLFHHASNLGKLRFDQQNCGWNNEIDPKHNWYKMQSKVQQHIKVKSYIAKDDLRWKNIKYFNSFAQLLTKHKIKLTDQNNNEQIITSKYICVAVGGRPRIPQQLKDIQQYLITSDDIFNKIYAPGKTLIVGGSYIALESAGFLNGLGFDTSVMYRSDLLKQFDQQMVNKIQDYMQKDGVKFLKKNIVISGEYLKNKKILIKYQNLENKQIISDIFDTILVATGRDPETKLLGLETLDIKLNQNGKIIVDQFQATNIKNIFSIGDAADNDYELTPVAIKSGQLLADRLFNNKNKIIDFSLIPTVIYTPIEYGCVGLSEENCIKNYSLNSLLVGIYSFRPIEWAFSQNVDKQCLLKVIVNTKDKDKVIGLHYFGPNAGEIILGFVVAMKRGLSKEDMCEVVGDLFQCQEVEAIFSKL